MRIIYHRIIQNPNDWKDRSLCKKVQWYVFIQQYDALFKNVHRPNTMKIV